MLPRMHCQQLFNRAERVGVFVASFKRKAYHVILTAHVPLAPDALQFILTAFLATDANSLALPKGLVLQRGPSVRSPIK